MRLRLRPYRATCVVAYFGIGRMGEGYNRDGFNDVLDRIWTDPDIEVELVEEYDDVCRNCDVLVVEEKGSIWGAGYTCYSALDRRMVKRVNAANSRVLRDLGLQFGSVVRLERLVELLAERIPILDDDTLGGQRLQEAYEKGLAALRQMWQSGGESSPC